ncbi:MAG TPA: sodium:calcium antiporter [candidate division Zixibacteria bacterium]|nr:sodium:calcium antiporter [candidate division Zixibacteria bacterium]
MDVVLLIGSLAVILVAAELFTNGIEWFGHKLNLAEGAVGSVLAAVATAMPETLIPVIAILGPLVFGGETEASHAVGVGAILGAPFMLSTLAMFVTGVAVVIFSRRGRRGTGMKVNVRILGRDVMFFLVGYAIAIGTAFLPPALEVLRWVAAAVLFVIYALYVRLHFADEAEEGDPEELNRLHATRLPGMSGPRALELDFLSGANGEVAVTGTPRMRIIVGQVVVALLLIIAGAQIFVGAVEHISEVIGLDPTILALIIAPIATELPEKFNSVLWVRTGKDTLAMGNITGAMVFQSCLPTVLGLLFTSWTFSAESAISFASAGVAFVATLTIFGTMLRTGRLSAWTLLAGGPLYLVYVFLALFTPLGAGAQSLH